ncbi:hypothetical protein RRF57_010637 [Xylaria bambusicola]|uniref:Uncharacterized protein n=1 Tax=Xylaria bambusicola TaxID=326684 RepID=A0AAN7Z2X7_9PEZI
MEAATKMFTIVNADIKKDALGSRVAAQGINAVAEAGADRGAGLSSAFEPKPSSNPQAPVSEGLATATLTTEAPIQPVQSVQPVFPILPAQPVQSVSPSLPSSSLAAALRHAAKNNISSPLLRGPVPQKGSGQDRFRQELLKGNDYPRLTVVDQNSSYIASTTSAPDLPAANPPLFTLGTTTSTCPGVQAIDRAVVTPAEVRGEMSLEAKKAVKGPSLTQPKVKAEDGNGQYIRQVIHPQPLATARLSAQCQLRHFNPKWQESSGPNGFKCSVQLQNKVIHGDRTYQTAYDAKQAVAKKALTYVRRLPCDDPSQKVVMRIRNGDNRTDIFLNGNVVIDGNQQGRVQVKSEPSANASHAGSHGQYNYALPADANASAYNWIASNYTDHGALVRHIQSLFGSTGPSPAIISDSMASRAFLQGLALGTSMRATSPYDPYLEPQGRPIPASSSDLHRPHKARERSPAPSVARNYRDRSPWRRAPHELNSRRST